MGGHGEGGGPPATCDVCAASHTCDWAPPLCRRYVHGYRPQGSSVRSRNKTTSTICWRRIPNSIRSAIIDLITAAIHRRITLAILLITIMIIA